MVGYVPGGMAWHSMMLGQGQEKSYIWTREAMVVALGIRRRGNGIQLAWGEVERRDRMAEESISAKELVPIVIACAVGGGRWVGRAVPVSCDNTGAMAAVNSGYSRSPQLNAPAKILVVFLSGLTSNWRCGLAMSREPRTLWLMQFPAITCLFSFTGTTGQGQPDSRPRELKVLLLEQQPDWTSTDWTTLFSSCFRQD